MNVPPGAPPPPMAAPPPLPPRPTNWLVWLLVGCGCLMFAGLLTVGGCFLLLGRASVKLKQVAERWEQLGDTHIRGNPVVERHLGRVTRVTHSTRRGRDSQDPVMSYRVQGEKDEGVVELEIEVKGAGDLMDPKVVASHLIYKGKKIDLATGRETEAPTRTPDPTPDPRDD